jgi:hypothetical protein
MAEVARKDNGKYQVRIYLGQGIGGKRRFHCKTFHHKKDAEEYGKKIEERKHIDFLLSVDEVSEILEIPVSDVYRLCREELLDYVRTKNKFKFELAWVENYIALEHVKVRRCIRCGEEMPATTQFFDRKGGSFKSWCKDCVKEHGEEYRSKKEEESFMERKEETLKNINFDEIQGYAINKLRGIAKRLGCKDTLNLTRKGLLDYVSQFVKEESKRGTNADNLHEEGHTGKICAQCKESKPFAEFNKNTSSGDGLQAYCRECQRESNRKRTNPNGEYATNGKSEGKENELTYQGKSLQEFVKIPLGQVKEMMDKLLKEKEEMEERLLAREERTDDIFEKTLHHYSEFLKGVAEYKDLKRKPKAYQVDNFGEVRLLDNSNGETHKGN